MSFPQYVDISSFQPAVVDWSSYVAWSKLVDGVPRLAVRASEGDGVGDANYVGYVQGIRAVDPSTVVIHYHYSYPQFNTATDEVNWMASQVAKVGLNPQDVIMLDFEENATAETNDVWALQWLQAAKTKFGRTPVIYASLSMVQNRLQNSALAAYPLILADWIPGSTPPAVPGPWQSMFAWQYTDNLSSVPGFGGAAVDADFFLGSRKLYTSNGTVISLQKSFQLDGGSQDKCGPWTSSELKYANLPGQPPLGSASDVQKWASSEYVKWIGPDVVSDQNGSSVDNMHEFFRDAGYHWWDISAIDPSSVRSHDNAEIIAALNAGYPVVVTVNEQSVIRPDGSHPYPWQPALGPVNHIFCIVGHTSDGYFLVDDELNQNDAWPDKYSQSKLEIHWATIIGLVGPDPSNPWFAPIPSGDPLSWPAGFVGQLFSIGVDEMGVPKGWTLSADGSTLTAPNGVSMQHGFMNQVLNAPAWNPGDVPQRPEYHTAQVLLHRPDLGAGQAIETRDHYLWYTDKSGVVNESELGLEIYLRNVQIGNLTSNLNAIQAQLVSSQTQLTACQAQLAACEASSSGVPADLQAAVNQAVSGMQSAEASVAAIVANLQQFVK